jgi:hypothetical protein
MSRKSNTLKSEMSEVLRSDRFVVLQSHNASQCHNDPRVRFCP